MRRERVAPAGSPPDGSPPDAGPPGAVRLRVDPVACEGIGICAHVAPGLVRVDMWGFPVLASDPLTGRRARRAVAAVASCPRRALFVAPEGG